MSRARFRVAARSEDVFDYLNDPRNLLRANHRKPIVGRSDPPRGTGSWAVIALDQIRARIDYTEVIDPARVAVHVGMSGIGSRSMAYTESYELAADGPTQTVVDLEMIPDRPSWFAQVLWPLLWRTIRRRMARSASERS